jgi:dihydropteroate synthase
MSPPPLTSPHGRTRSFDEPLVMGIVNVTPDSFSDGGATLAPERAVAHAMRLAAEGAHLLDLGAESTRPGAAPVAPEVQRERLEPVVRALRARPELEHVLLSIDTRLGDVFGPLCELGADLLNDVSALGTDPSLARLAARLGAPVILMHMQGEPATMQAAPRYADVVREVSEHLLERAAFAEAAGVAPSQLVFDPGFGFGKTLTHNLALFAGLPSLAARLARPLLVGLSRKRMLGALSGEERPDARDLESVVAGALAVERGAHVLRVHAVRDHVRALAVLRGLTR